MTKKKTAAAQLSRLAQEAGEEVNDRGKLPTHLPDEKAEKLRRNIGRIVMVPRQDIRLSENVRKYIPTETPEFQQLVDSVRQDGLLQNLIAELKVEDSGAYLNLISGQRRYLAAEIAKLEICPVRIVQYSDRGSKIAHGIAENVLRENLHCLDLAEAYAELLKEGWPEDQIAETFDRRRQTIMQHLRLAKYPEEAKALIRENRENFNSYDLLNKFVAHRWKTDDALVVALKNHLTAKTEPKVRAETTATIKEKGRELSRRSGYRIGVAGTQQIGKITIRWDNEVQRETLFRLLEKMPKVKQAK